LTKKKTGVKRSTGPNQSVKFWVQQAEGATKKIKTHAYLKGKIWERRGKSGGGSKKKERGITLIGILKMRDGTQFCCKMGGGKWLT